MGSPEDKMINVEEASPEEVPLVAIISPKDKAGEAEIQEAKENANESTLEKEEKPKIEFAGMDKYELQKFANDPFWKKVRWAIFILFWLVWVAMLLAVILIIVFSPKCPPRPERKFWQNPAYRIQVKSFASDASDNRNQVGNLKGVQSKLDYLLKRLNIKNFILDNLVLRGPSKCTLDFKQIDPAVGTVDDLKALCKAGRKKGFFFMMEFDPSQTDPTHQWFLDPKKQKSYYNYDASMMGADYDKVQSRDGKPAWKSGFYSGPNSQCHSLNLNNTEARSNMFDAMRFWLDAGVSGFVLTNVAFLNPLKKSNIAVNEASAKGWFQYDPTSYLYSEQSVSYVKGVRSFLKDEATKRDKDLVLFVDFGNTGFPVPASKIADYYGTDADNSGAQVIINPVLGSWLSPKAKKDMRQMKSLLGEAVVDLKVGSKNQAFVTNWHYLQRQPSETHVVLGLTLPGVPVLFYGQEIGMSHVANMLLITNASSPSYLPADESTDMCKTPMQWTGNTYNTGWLKEANASLAWVELTLRQADIQQNNLMKFNAAGHPYSILNLTSDVLTLIANMESLQWGDLQMISTVQPEVIAFTRKAVRFPGVLVAINFHDKLSATVNFDLGEMAELKIFFSKDGDGKGATKASYKVGDVYSISSVFLPPNSVLVFQID